MRTSLLLSVCIASCVWSLSACDNTQEADPVQAQPPAEGLASPEDYPADAEAGKVALRRLTQTQFQNTITDLVGDEIVVPQLAEPDLEIGGLLSVGASGATMSARGVESLEDIAFAVAEQALANDAVRARLVTCQPSGPGDEECAREFVQTMGRRAWRRPLDDEEVDRLVTLAGNAAERLDDFYGGVEAVLAALLQSPNFIFRVEIGVEDSGQRRFTDHELATRLSFFLWNTTPDDVLLAAADEGKLSTDEGLLEQAERLLESPRARQGMRNFFTEHLKLYELNRLIKDPTIFEHYNAQLGDDAREETLSLLEHVVFDAQSDWRDVMTTRETFVNPNLAALYKIPSPTTEGFGLVELPADGQRAGLMGHASFLNAHAHPVSSSATLRGMAVRTILLCQEIPPPPVNVDTSIPEPSGEAPTLRERVAEHLENPSCAGCHSLTDPIGLGLENFDGVGRWRDLDNDYPIDPSGDLDGTFFDTPIELGAALRNHPDFGPCMVRTLARYATGRVEAFEERNIMHVLEERFEVHGYRVKPLILELVMSPLFRRPGEPK